MCLWQELEEELVAIRQELAAAREVAARASGTWDKFRKERDFHRMHHKRVAQEKNKLITDIKRLKVLSSSTCLKSSSTAWGGSRSSSSSNTLSKLLNSDLTSLSSALIVQLVVMTATAALPSSCSTYRSCNSDDGCLSWTIY